MIPTRFTETNVGDMFIGKYRYARKINLIQNLASINRFTLDRYLPNTTEQLTSDD